MRKLVMLILLVAGIGGTYLYFQPTTDPVSEVYEFIQTRGVTEINVELVNNVMHIQFTTPTLPESIVEAGYDKLTAMLNIGTIKGGIQGATVPDYCEEEVLRCMLPGESEEEVTQEIKSVIDSVKKVTPT